MKNALLWAVMTVLVAAHACAATGSSPVSYDAKPGEALRAKYGLLVQTWRDRLPKILEDDPEQVRKQVERVLHAYVVNPREVRVQIAPTSAEQLAEGSFPRIVFEFRDGMFDTGKVTHLLADMRDVQLNYEELLLYDRIRFEKPGHVEYICEITEKELNHAIFELGDKKLNVKNPHIELRRETLRFTGRVPHMLGSTNVRVDGTMKVVNGTKIHFVPSALRLSIMPMPGFVAREIFQRINPIADLDRLKMKATPDLIVSRTDRLYILTRGMQSEIGKDRP